MGTGEKILVIIGTFILVVFNIFAVGALIATFKSLPVLYGIIITVIFGGAIFFNWKLIQYYIKVFRKMKKDKKDNS